MKISNSSLKFTLNLENSQLDTLIFINFMYHNSVHYAEICVHVQINVPVHVMYMNINRYVNWYRWHKGENLVIQNCMEPNTTINVCYLQKLQ